MEPVQATLFGAGEPAAEQAGSFQRIQLDADSWVDVARLWLWGADALLSHLLDVVPWRQSQQRMYERLVDTPRLSCWYREDDALPHGALADVRDLLGGRYGVSFGSVGLNLYRDGRDSVAFHRDRELRRLDDTLIAIVTLGAQRPFRIRPLGGGASLDLSPASGDLLVMGGACQRQWEHGVPKVSGRVGPRISASYRWTKAS